MKTAFDKLRDVRQQKKDLADLTGSILTKAQRENRSLTPTENRTFESKMNEVDALNTTEKRLLDEIEHMPAIDHRTAGREDTHTIGNSHYDRRNARDPQKIAFRNWMAGGAGVLTSEELTILESASASMPDELRALSAVTGSAGAYTVPQGFSNMLDVALKSFGGILAACGYLDTPTGATLPYPTMNDTGNEAAVLAEGSATADDADPSFGVVNFGSKVFSSGMIRVPLTLLRDSAFDAEGFLNDAVGTRLARKLNRECTVGAGSNGPTGIVTSAYAGVTAAATSAITYNELLNLFHSVDPEYRRPEVGAGWMFNDDTLLQIRKLVDSNGRPLYIDGGAVSGIDKGAPATLLGLPVYINQHMASMAASAVPIVFGALSKYKVRRVATPLIQRLAERYAEYLQVGFLAHQSYDGKLLDAGTHPVKKLTMAAS